MLSPTFTQLQQLRNFYGFPDKLDIDRYTVNGQDAGLRRRGPRAELRRPHRQPDQLDQPAHGLHARQRLRRRRANDEPCDAAAGRLPSSPSSDTAARTGPIPDSQAAADLLRRADHRTTRSSAARAARPRASTTHRQRRRLHLHRHRRRADRQPLQPAGVRDRVRERNILLSGAINANSKIMYVREPARPGAEGRAVPDDRHRPVPGGGRRADRSGSSTATPRSTNYPYAERDDAGRAPPTRGPRRAHRAQPRQNQINYIRNSVKATVDAYDGTVTLYAFDDDRPGAADLDEGVPGHRAAAARRSPAAARRTCATRRTCSRCSASCSPATTSTTRASSTAARTSGRCRTTRPSAGAAARPQPPYYLRRQAARRRTAPTFQLTSALNALQRRHPRRLRDGRPATRADYGKITVLELPRQTRPLGPSQVQRSSSSTPTVAQTLTLLNSRASQRRLRQPADPAGGGGLLYVEPSTSSASGSPSYPHAAAGARLLRQPGRRSRRR